MLKEYTYLSDKEYELVRKFVENEATVEAVRKVLLSGVYDDGIRVEDKPAEPLKNFILGKMSQPLMINAPMETKGMEITSVINAVSMVERGFEELDRFKVKKPEVEKEKNKAR